MSNLQTRPVLQIELGCSASLPPCAHAPVVMTSRRWASDTTRRPLAVATSDTHSPSLSGCACMVAACRAALLTA